MTTETFIIAVCEQCGREGDAGVGFGVEGDGPMSFTLSDAQITPGCRYCGGTLRIPHGVYDIDGGTLQRFTAATPDDLCVLQRVLIRVQREDATPEEAAAAVDRALPGRDLGAMVLHMARSQATRDWIMILLALVSIVLQTRPSGLSAEEVQHMLRVAVHQARADRPPPGQLPGRNDPCYCGSGVKFKRCHAK